MGLLQELSEEECRDCREALQRLLVKVYQPLVIKELLVLQGGSRQVRVRVLRRQICSKLTRSWL